MACTNKKKNMKKALFSLALLLCLSSLLFGESQPLDLKLAWSGYKGKALAAPAVTKAAGPDNLDAVHVEAVASGEWQGGTGILDAPVDFSKYAALEFHIRHNLTKNNGGRHTMALILKGKNAQCNCSFVAVSDDWCKVTVPIDSASFSASSGTGVNLEGITEMRIYPFAALNSKGKFIEFTGMRLLPKQTGPKALAVMSYTHRFKPTSGENGHALTDGDTAKNVHFRAYSDNPDIVFDLGARFALDTIEVSANAAPSHNFSELSIQTSYDNVSFVSAGVLKNTEEGTDERLVTYRFAASKPIVGRYVRICATRPRSDFPVNISEVAFKGHTPSEKEIALAAECNYDTGVPMPARTSADYFELKRGPLQLWISRKNGVVNGLFHNGKLLVERLTPQYTLQTRAQDTVINGMDDCVIDAKSDEKSVTLTIENPKLPGLAIRRTWALDGQTLWEKVALVNRSMKERVFLRMATNVILAQDFRKDGFYEMPGTAIAVGMVRMPASEVQMERGATNIPTIAFENGRTRQVVWHTRFRHNGRFTYMDVGTEEDNLQIFRPNGWMLTGATFVPADAPEQSFENRFSITDGGMLKAFGEYLDTPEAAAFRSQIKRPAWLRDVRSTISMGWDGNYRESSDRLMWNYVNAFSKRGVLVEPAMGDLDGYWGEWRTKGKIHSWYGGYHTPEELQEKVPRLRAFRDNIKLGYYTWFWSAFPWSAPVKNHPEWFVSKLRNGAAASWFPGLNVNYLRFCGIPESRHEMEDQIENLVNFYDLDVWYVDGGKSGTYAKDWETMRIDDPHGQTDFYLETRERIRKNNDGRIIFFNHSENPIGDMGYLESFEGTLTNEWRRGAILMWKFKMYSWRDPLHHSVYIYWLPGVDGALHNYIAGIGAMPSYSSRDFKTADLPFISARYDIRQAELTEADVSPDWRLDAKEELELMALRQGNNGWLFIHPHETGKSVRKISANSAALGMTDKSRPIYAWLYTIRNGKTFQSPFGDGQVAADYQKSGWSSERAVVPQFLGRFAWSERFSQSIAVEPKQAQVLMLSQVPAVIVSAEGEPCHYLLSSQPDIQITGGDGRFSVDSEIAAEIGMILEDGQMPKRITVNGKAVASTLRTDRNLRLAVVKVEKGKSEIAMETVNAQPVAATALDVSLSGRVLNVKVAPENAPVSLYFDGALLLSRVGSFSLELPETVRDGEYEAVSGNLNRKWQMKGLGKPFKMKPLLVPLPIVENQRKLNVKRNGFELLAAAEKFTDKASTAVANANEMTLTAGTNRTIESHYNNASAAFELKAKRFVKINVSSKPFCYFNKYGYEPKRHSIRPTPQNFGGLFIDYGTAAGYTARSAAGLGVQNEKRVGQRPDSWGKKTKPDHIYLLDTLFLSDKEDQRDYWLDLQELGAPDDWDGRIWLTAHTENLSADRSFIVTLLETTDKLPTGAKPQKTTAFGVVSKKNFEFQKVKGTPDWTKITPLGTMTPLSPTMDFFKTEVKAAWDDENVYLLCSATETPGRPLNSDGARLGKPWMGDGAEFFVELSNEPGMQLHGLVDVGGCQYAEIGTLAAKPGDKIAQLPTIPYKSVFKKTSFGWEMAFTVPWSAVGGRPKAGQLLGFNVMRNRLEQGVYGHYSFAPSTRYFSGRQYQFEIK